MGLKEKQTSEINQPAYLERQEHIRKQALRELFKRDGIDYDLTEFKLPKRCFLWIKTLICLLLKRTGASFLQPNYFCVLSFDKSSDIWGRDCNTVWISSDLFKGWAAAIIAKP